ncbi:hypothetical protein Vafri_4037 [Volvox africanus]|uniref:Uncharacterized protein n=1 Tax=Volvox africanus TaxID=51714 RepID=A0A8J4EVD7_9CHLO|nr:hypothetical protein Vafri_4037 [Volvox africanus]
MDLNEKALARQKFRSSRGRGRAGRGGAHRGGQYTGLARGEPHRDLASNAYRYEDDVEEEGVVAPKSQGADLETLIEDADVQFNQSFYRFRAQLHDITEEVPPLGATHPEQLLAIDLDALAGSLSALPLHMLLGLEPQFLADVEVDVGRQGQPPPSCRPPVTTPKPEPATREQQYVDGIPYPLASQVAVPVASPGATVGAVRAAPFGLPGPPASTTRPSHGIAAGPAAIGGPVVRLPGQTVLAAAGSRGVLSSQASGQCVIAGQSTAPLRAPAAAAGAGRGNSGGHENVVLDDDLRLLLGLQVAGSGSANAGPAAAAVQPSMQVSRIGLKTTPVTRPPAGGRPAPQQSQQTPAEDLDDWLKSL